MKLTKIDNYQTKITIDEKLTNNKYKHLNITFLFLPLELNFIIIIFS